MIFVAKCVEFRMRSVHSTVTDHDWDIRTKGLRIYDYMLVRYDTKINTFQ